METNLNPPIFEVAKTEKTEAENIIFVIGLAFDVIHTGDILVSCNWRNSSDATAYVRVDEIDVMHRIVESVERGFSARLTLSLNGNPYPLGYYLCKVPQVVKGV